MNILVTGACGYKGSVLVPKLLRLDHKVVAVDVMWFGNFLNPHEKLTVKNFDIRDADNLDLSNIDVVIHLASVANDPCGDLDPKLTWEISCLATMRLAENAKNSKVKQFIYASSGSVYGIKDEKEVTDVEIEEFSVIEEYEEVEVENEEHEKES